MGPLQLFSAQGRIGQVEHLKAWALTLAGFVGLHLSLTFVYGTRYLRYLGDGGLLASLPALVVLVGYFWAQQSRRLHDLGHRGWWPLLVFVPPVVLVALVDIRADPEELYRGLLVVALTALLGFVAWTLLAKGEAGSNRFGPPAASRGQGLPLSASAATVASSLGADARSPSSPGVSAGIGAAARQPGAGVYVAPTTAETLARVPSVAWSPSYAFSFAGRHGRLAFLVHTLIGVVAFAAAVSALGWMARSDLMPGELLPIPAVALLLPVLWYVAANLVKRAHDRGHSAWTVLAVLLAIVVPEALTLVPGFKQQAPLLVLMLLAALSGGAGALAYFVAFFMPGEPQANRYGPRS